MKSPSRKRTSGTAARSGSRDLLTALIGAKLIRARSAGMSAIPAEKAMVRAARTLQQSGVSVAKIPGILRKLTRLLQVTGASTTGVPRTAQKSDEASGAYPRGRVVIDIRATRSADKGSDAPAARRMAEASLHFERGLALEESDTVAARAAYAEALAKHSEHLSARINLGRLMHLDGELDAAEEVYRAAKQGSALLAFNLGLLLEDRGRDDEAVQAYREALALDPAMHEAHLNLSLLHERLQRPRDALRHMLAFRRSAEG